MTAADRRRLCRAMGLDPGQVLGLAVEVGLPDLKPVAIVRIRLDARARAVLRATGAAGRAVLIPYGDLDPEPPPTIRARRLKLFRPGEPDPVAGA